MRKRSISSPAVVATIALMTGVLIASVAVAQMDHGPKTEKGYGIGLPRDHASQLFADKDYPVFPLKPGQEAYQEAYKDIDAVVNVVHNAGLARKVARLRPIGVIKG